MSAKAIVTSVVTAIIAALVGIYIYVYALQTIIEDTAIFNGTGQVLVASLFVIMYFLAVALLPIAVLYKSVKGGGK